MKKNFILSAICCFAIIASAATKVETFEGAENASDNNTYLTTATESFFPSDATGLKWETLLGSIRTGLGNFSSTAVVIRARKYSEATAGKNYAYLQSDSITGGIGNLSFTWNSNGSESSRINPWNIIIYINGDSVGSITDVCGSKFNAGSEPVFTKENINIEGKFVIKIENKADQDGTTDANHYRFVLDNLSWTTYSATGLQTPNFSFAEKTLYKVLGSGNFTNPLTNTSDGTVTYSSSNSEHASINANTGEVSLIAEGETTITAIVAETENYEADTASYTLYVKPALWKLETFSKLTKTCIVNPTANAETCSQVPFTDSLDNNIPWTYWLGGGNTQVFGNNAMYLRARKNTETAYDYGFILSDTITGGLSSLSFQWNQGGSESGLTYNVIVTVNGTNVGSITSEGQSAVYSEAQTFSVSGLTFTGNVVIKIENQTAYDGTSNKGRIVIDNLEWIGYNSSTPTNLITTETQLCTVYPKIVSDIIHIQTTEPEYTITLFNQLGIAVMKLSNTKVLDTNTLPAGMYILEMQTKTGQKQAIKLIKK